MKLELYKAYKTRAGHKVVVLEVDSEGDFRVWHKEGGYESTYMPDGKSYIDGDDGYDIVSEWEEPKSGTVWVNVWTGYKHFTHHTVYNSKESAEADELPSCKLLARFSYDWKEGEGL